MTFLKTNSKRIYTYKVDFYTVQGLYVSWPKGSRIILLYGILSLQKSTWSKSCEAWGQPFGMYLQISARQ